MSKQNMAETATFSLEMDDRSDDERSQSRRQKKDRLLSPSNLVNTGQERIPMDMDYLHEARNTTPKIRFNWNFNKKLRGSEELEVQENLKKFDIKSLFAAVSSGDVSQLQGLELYLHRTMKHLTNSEYQSNGKNALLKALLNLKDGRNDTVEFLLDVAEKMGDLKEFVNAAYTDSYYRGHTALHIAIERRSKYFVELLVRKGADVHAKACGKFFQPHDGPSFYFGELPLSLAACTNQRDVVDFLMDNPYQKVNITETDSLGNTVLHALVLLADNSVENTNFINSMYDYVLTRAAKLHSEIRLEDFENKEGLTPLKLAAKTGKIGVFEHMIQRKFHEKDIKHLSRKFTEWVYGPVSSSLYDLTSVDSYERNSAMEIIVYGSTIPNRLEMLQIEPLNRLLKDKWERFVKWIFLINFLVYVFYLSVFTAVAYNTKRTQEIYFVEHSRNGYLQVTGQVICALGAIYFFFKGLSDLRRKHPKMQTLLVDGYSEILFFIQAILFIITSVLYCCGKQEYLGFMVLCLALSWINLLYFSRGSRHMGIYSVIIQKMILSDVLRFLFVYMVYLFGFSAAVVTLLEEPAPSHTIQSGGKGRSFFQPVNNSSDCKKPTFKSFSFTTLELFKFTIGMGDLEFTEQYQYKEVFYVLLISYIVFTYILLLNMLIALMNRTVEKLSEESRNIWKLQQAITILDLERSLPSCLRKRFRSGVEKELGTVPGRDQRWCFSVEEVNWSKWRNDMGIINEDPGDHGVILLSPSQARGRSWRQLLSRTLPQCEEHNEIGPIRSTAE
ncbi:transient receptor potential cation channel subfamily V member 1-like isoform X2 [Scleropages formosus]|uniref:transient receptor potential cation channel subfamily V member 1-like isoform X2 n=1 Tax=Scleropages formosus TaxID=113540 RepID=UPI0008785D75|nr:transient receptor potential cation channel subfamily V member 1-like isoform X2 [Scleropages formosus]